MSRNLKALLAQKLNENTERHSAASQDAVVDLGRQHAKLSLDLIDPNPYQPRKTFPSDELESLACSIAEAGLLQPVTVRAVGERYQLIAGERRLRAHKILARRTIEAIVVPVEEADMAILALAENLDREDLSDFEIGLAIRQIESLFSSKKKLAESLGVNREDMYRYFAFESLPAAVIARLHMNPRLLARSAAADVKRVLQQAEDQKLAEEILLVGWSLLEANEIDQSKLATFVLHELRRRVASTALSPSMAEEQLERGGRKVGSIRRDVRNIVIRLKAAELNDDQQSRLRLFLKTLVTEEV
tara:strand:+ start:18569 stop:19474 length:906 start_codon:yes stop_codon:yes gene_type:complete